MREPVHETKPLQRAQRRPRAVETPLDRLREHPDNPRKITPARLEQLKRTLAEDPAMLQARPLIALPDGTVIAGNMRLRAARELGWSRIPVFTVDLDEQQARLWMLRDNNGYGDWDDEAVAQMLAGLDDELRAFAGFDDREARRLLRVAARGLPDPPPAGERPKRPRTRRGQLVELGRHRLICGDATDEAVVDELLGGATLACVVTSPPYAVGLDYASYDDTLENLRPLLRAIAELWRDRIRPGGYAVVNFGDVVTGSGHAGAAEPCEYPMALEHWPVFRAAGWLLHTRRVWAKPHARVAAPWTASSNRAATDWEHVWTWKRPGRGLNERRDPSYLGVWDTTDAAALDVGKDEQPAPFPINVPRWALEIYSDPGDAVADPFAGTGTTLFAAELTGRTCYAVELDRGYCDVIRDRWARWQQERSS